MINLRLLASKKLKLSQTKTKQKSFFYNYHKFNLLFLSTIILSLTGVGLVNFLIDPYDIFKYYHPIDLNFVKPEKLNRDRLYKAIDIINLKPEIIFLGSSRTKQGLDPNHSGFAQNQTIYNLGIDGANMYEILRYLEHTIENQPKLQTVILGIDHFMFNDFSSTQANFSNHRLEKSHITRQDLVNSLFSHDALLDSRKTITINQKRSPDDSDLTYGDNGFFPHRNIKDGKTAWRFHYSINQYLEFHPRYQLSEDSFKHLEKIVQLCHKNNIKLIVFISPSHATQWQLLNSIGRWESFEIWKRRLVNITPIWDFSGYNSLTTEPIKDIMTNYSDNSHYSPYVGKLVLNRILSYQTNQVPKDFGILVTEKNIEEHLANLRQGQLKWAETNSKDVELVETLKQDFEKKQKLRFP